MTTATLATNNATTQQLPRQAAQQPGRNNRITERDPDYLRLRAATERQLTDSLRQLVREVRRARHDTRRVAQAQSAFIRRHTDLLRQAYVRAHQEGARDYFGAVSHQPSRWARRVQPSGARMEQRLLFYAAGSVTRIANEAALAAHQMHLARAQQGAPIATRLRETVERVTGAFSRVLLADGGAPDEIPADALDAWFVGMRGRLQLQSEISWNGLQDGYSNAGAVDPASPYTVVYWELGPVKTEHCSDCPLYAAGSPYGRPGSGDNELNATPGDGHTECGAACHCSLRHGSDPDAVRRAVFAWLDAGVAAGWIDPEAWAQEQEMVPTAEGAAVGVEPGPAYADLPTDEVHLRSLMIDALDQYRAAVEAYQATIVAQGQSGGGLPDLLSSNADALAQMLEALPTLTAEQQRLVVEALDATASFAQALEQATSLGFDQLLWDVGYIRLAEPARGWGFIDYQHDPKTGRFAPTGAGGETRYPEGYRVEPRTVGDSAARGEHGTKGYRGPSATRRKGGPAANNRSTARGRERKAAEYQVSSHHAAMRKLAARIKGAQPAERMELQRRYHDHEAQVAPHVERLLQMGVSEAEINRLAERWHGWRFFNPNHDPHSGRFAPGGMGGDHKGEGGSEGAARNAATARTSRARGAARTGGRGARGSSAKAAGTSKGYVIHATEEGRQNLRNVFGRDLTDDEIGGLVGAQRGDHIYLEADHFNPRLSHLELHGGNYDPSKGRYSDENGDTYFAARTLHRDAQGRPVLTNDAIELTGETPRGQYIGTAIFARQVKNAAALGVHHIETNATGSKGDVYNGYYTWARLGYNQHFNARELLFDESEYPSLPAVVRHARTMHGLMRTQEGRDWWRENGSTWAAVFNLKPGSVSRRVLNKYLRERNIKLAERSVETLEWTDDDERAADAAWRELDEELRQEEAAGLNPMEDDALPPVPQQSRGGDDDGES